MKKVLHNVTVHQAGHLPRVVQGCTVSKTQNFFRNSSLFKTRRQYTYKSTIEERSPYSWCCGRAVSFTYPEFLC